MALNYQFIDKKTGEPKLLNDVDRELCEEFGHVYSEKTYCTQYQALRMIGIGILMRTGGNEVTEEKIEKYFEETDIDYLPEEMDFVHEYFNRYTFKAWR